MRRSAPGSLALLVTPPKTEAIDDSMPRKTFGSDSPNELAIWEMLPLSRLWSSDAKSDSAITPSFSLFPPPSRFSPLPCIERDECHIGEA